MHKDDQMTPNERMSAFMSGKEIDRLPTMPFLVSVGGKIAGMTHREKRSNAKNHAKAQIECYNRFGHDTLVAEYGLHGIGVALGSKTNDPENDVPAIIDHVLKDLSDIDSLDFTRIERKNDPWLQLNYDAAQIALEETGGEVGLGISIPGPFTAASSIYKTDELLRAMRRNPELVHKLLRLCTDAVKYVCGEFFPLGASITLCDPIASGTILKQKEYREFVQPYSKEIIQHVHDKGAAVCYHICGDTTNIVEDMVECGCDMLSLDNRVKLELAKEKVGDRVCIIGNVDPVDTVMLGDDAIIDASVKACFRQAYDSPKGYLCATGCDIPIHTPFENIDSYMKAVRKYGKWPLNPNLYFE